MSLQQQQQPTSSSTTMSEVSSAQGVDNKRLSVGKAQDADGPDPSGPLHPSGDHPDHDEPIVVEDEKREPESKDERGGSRSGNSNTSLVTAFRDFFLAAFSDNYSYQDVRKLFELESQVCTSTWRVRLESNTCSLLRSPDNNGQAYCCGADTTLCSVPRGSSKVAPDQQQQDGIRTQNSSTSFHDLEPSASRDSSRRRRRKPLAIAVGFNYAEDMNGRPVVITRGSRKPLPSELPRSSSGRNVVSSGTSRHGRKHSPASVRTDETPPAAAPLQQPPVSAA